MPKLLLRTAAAPPSNDIARLVARFDDQIRVQTAPLPSILEARLQKLRFGPRVAATFGTFASWLCDMSKDECTTVGGVLP